jgi:phosphonate transport system substrate-binding protein
MAPLRVGAVAYHPRVERIWDAFAAWFAARGGPIASRLFEDYDAQVAALLAGDIDVAWNTNLAYVQTQRMMGGGCGMLAMRDNDRDWRAHVMVRDDSDASSLADLAGGRIGFASSDSPQATILPIHYMRAQGFDPAVDAVADLLEVDLGKHGDTGNAERGQLARLAAGDLDAAVVADATCAGLVEVDRVDGVPIRRVWTTPPFHHCNFTVLPDHDPELSGGFRDGLAAMRDDDPAVADAMRLEWVSRWVDGDQRGYLALYAALGVPVPV